MNFSDIKVLLLNTKSRLQAITDLRERIEIVHTSEFSNFLTILFPTFKKLLLYESNNDPKFRNVLLEVLNRLPNNDVLKPYVNDLLEIAMKILKVDVEDNALICLRIIFDLHKNYRPSLEKEVQPFLDQVQVFYKALEHTVDKVLNAENGQVELKSIESFKVLTECPLIVMLLFQLYPRFIESNIPALIPLMMKTLTLRKNKNSGVRYAEFLACQVKTLSFLTYLLRGFSNMMRSFEDSIGACVIQLLATCPQDAVTTRKELLVATRHILATDFRKGFFSHIDTLADENVLIGSGRACHQVLRPLAYSTLADLVHHVRTKLSMKQLGKLTYIFSRNIHDATLPVTIQTTSVRLLLSFVDTIFRNQDPDPNKGRKLLLELLQVLVSKFGTLRTYIIKLQQKNKNIANEDTIDDVKTLLRTMIMGLKTVIYCISQYRRPQEKKLNTGMLRMESNSGEKLHTMSSEERYIVAVFLKNGLKCFLSLGSKDEKEVLDHFAGAFAVLEMHNFKDIFISNMPRLFDCILKEHAMLTIPQHFLANANASGSFAAILLDFLSSKMEFLNTAAKDSQATVILRLFKIVFGSVTLFSTNEPILQPHLRPIVAKCLRSAMEVDHPLNYYHLLRALFRSISGRKFESFYKEFQPVLPGLLSGLIRLQKCTPDVEIRNILLELCLTVPARLSSLLQYLPLLMPPLVLAISSTGELVNLGLRTLEFWVDNLNPEFLFPIMSGQDSLLTDLIEALCSHLHPPPYPYGTLAMRLLGKLGGRNRRFLKEPLSLSCAKHPESGFSMDFSWIKNEKVDFTIPLNEAVIKSCALLEKLCCVVEGTDLAISTIIHHKRQAFNFLVKSLSAFLKLDSDISSFKVARCTTRIITEVDLETEAFPQGIRNASRRQAATNAIFKILKSLFYATKDPELKQDSLKVLRRVAKQFTIIVLSYSCRYPPNDELLEKYPPTAPHPRGLSPSRDSSFEARVNAISMARFGQYEMMECSSGLDVFLFHDVLVDSLCNVDTEIVHSVYEILQVMVDVCEAVYDDSRAEAVKFGGALFGYLASAFIHCCYGKTWHAKVGGCRGIRRLCEIVHDDWILEHELFSVRALLFVLGDHLPEATVIVGKEAGDALECVLLKCHPPRKLDSTKGEEVIQTDLEIETIKMLTLELLSPKKIVRVHAKKSLGYLSSILGIPVSKMILPYESVIRNQVFIAPLRQLPPANQVGYMDAIAYGLELDPPLFTMSQELLNFLQEVWLLTSADDPSSQCIPGSGMSTMLGGISAGQLYPCELSHSVYLRLASIACIRAAFITCPETLNEHEDARNKFVSVFFRSLTGQPDEVVSAAQGALTDIIDMNKKSKDKALPKTLLQACLRPVLLNLADFRKLTLQLLQGLARLLMLLSNCFNATLGEKLLEHLRQWEDPAKIISAKIWIRGEEPAVAAGIVNLFHLLPPSQSFLNPLVDCVVKLEDVLPRYGNEGRISSPYRLPLTKFLNRYASRAVELFLKRENLSNRRYSNLFFAILKSKEAGPLRAVLTVDGGAELIMASTFVTASKISGEESNEDISKSTKSTKLDENTKKIAETKSSTSQLVQAQIQQNSLKIYNQALASAQAQGTTAVMASERAKSAQNAYIQRAQAQSKILKGGTSNEGLELHFQGLFLVKLLSKIDPEWLSRQRIMVDCIRKLWRSSSRLQRLKIEEKMNFRYRMESKYLVKCLIVYCRVRPDDVQVLFDLLTIFLHESLVDFSFLKSFYLGEVAEKYAPENKKLILKLFLGMLKEQTASEELKVQALRLLVLPMLTATFANPEVANTSVVDTEIMDAVMQNVLGGEVFPEYNESLRIELLQLATLLIQHMGTDLLDHRKELIKFAWNHLKSEDTTSKQWAYVNVCRFIAVYETPPKIILQVYVALLRTFQADAKELVRDALDILTPALPKRLPSSDFIKAIKWTKKIIYEEGHAVQQLVHIWQLLVRQPSLFYGYRAQFVPQMVNSLNRLALPPNSPIENKTLAISLVDLIVSWDQRRRNEVSTTHAKKKQKTEDSTPASVEDDFQLNATMVEMIVNFLVRFSLGSAEGKDNLASKCVELFSKSLQLWPNAMVRFAHFEKLTNSALEENTLKVAIRMLNSLFTSPDGTSFVIKHFEPLQAVLDPCFDIQSVDLRADFKELILHMVKHSPNNVLPWVQLSVHKRCISVGVEDEKSTSRPTLEILQVLFQQSQLEIDLFVGSLLKLADKLTRDHLQAVVMAEAIKEPTLDGSTGGAQTGVNAGPHSRDFVMASPTLALVGYVVHDGAYVIVDRRYTENTSTSNVLSKTSITNRSGDVVDCLQLCFSLLFKANNFDSEGKKIFIKILLQCVEKSRCIPLLISITKKISSWILSDTKLSSKDVIAFLAKMNLYDRLNENDAQPLVKLHRDLVLQLSKRNSATSSVASPHLTAPFMVSLMSPELEFRKQCFNTFPCPDSIATRLEFILHQDWSGCGTRYWIITAVELLLRTMKESHCGLAKGLETFPLANHVESGVAMPEKAINLFREDNNVLHADFDILEPLRDLLHLDVSLAEDLWIYLFSKIWSHLLDDSGRIRITEYLTTLLSKRYHRRRIMLPDYRKESCNIVRTILHAISKCNPQPNIPAELVYFLATTYNAWYYVVPICEYQVLSDATSIQDRERWVSVLSSLYKELSQDDLRIGLSHRFSMQRETRLALTLESRSEIAEAQDLYFKVMSNAHGSKIPGTQLTKFEMKIWEERWVNCARYLNQWPLLVDFSRSIQNQDLLLEASWKRGDWNIVKQLLNASSIQARAESGDPEVRLKKLYLAIQDGNKPQIELLSKQTMHLALAKWKSLPAVLSHVHVPLLHLFHKFSELTESASMMYEIQTNLNAQSNASKAKTLPDFKNILSTWRERLPNKWDSILLWDDILAWRCHMFSIVMGAFSGVDPSQLVCMHDQPWSIIKLASIARKQGLHEVSLCSLAKLYSVNTMDVQDAFSKLREQVIICYQKPTELRSGLNIINNTNLDYFNPVQKAELFRLKGLFLDSLGGKNEANQSFSYCLSICDNYSKGWLSWGKYCDKLFLNQKQIEFAVQAMACYLQAVHHRSTSARMMLSRVLWLLSMDDEKGNLAHAFEAHGKQLPIWIWIVWIPQLLTALSRPEAPQVRGLLRGVAAKFPQALYYTMRAFLLEKREFPANEQGNIESDSVADAAGAEVEDAQPSLVYLRTKTGHVVAVPADLSATKLQEIPGLVGPPRSSPEFLGFGASSVLTLEAWKERVEAGGDAMKTTISSMQYTEDLMGFLRRSHPTLAFELEAMLEEMIIRFRPLPHEELLSAIHALLIKCHQIPLNEMDKAMPVSLYSTLERVAEKFFDSEDSCAVFVNTFKDSFYRDFMTEQKDATVKNIIEALKKWKNVLLCKVTIAKKQV